MLYRRSFSVLRPLWGRLFTASLSAALHAFFSAALIWMVGPLLMTLFQGGDVGVGEASGILQDSGQAVQEVTSNLAGIKEFLKTAVSDLVGADTREGMLYRFCWVIMVVVVSKNLFLYLQGFHMAYVQQSVIRRFRDQLFEKYQRLSLSFFHGRRTGEVISHVTNDVVVLNEAIDIGFNRLVTDSLQALFLASFLVILSWKLTLVAAIILPVVFGFIWFVGKKLRKYSERSQERMADVNAVLEESISNIRIVKAFASEEFEIKKFSRTTYNYFRSLLRMTRIRHLASPINDTLATIAGVVILLYAGSRIINGTGDLDAGDFMTFLLAMFTMIKPVKSLTQIHIKIQEGMAAASRIFGVIDTVESIRDSENAVKVSQFRDSIRYNNVSFRYLDDEPVINDISFEIRKGEVLALVGPSGAGKSTLFDLLPRFYDPQKGSITLDGEDIRLISLASLRSLMGIVTQETFLFNDSIRNNIAYGLNGVPDEEVFEAARMANADDFIRDFNKGYDTVVGDRGVRLSGGQRQRMAIARALLRNPQILIFDEATSSLDTESELLVQQAIDRLIRNRTTLVIAHRLSTIKNADRILVIDKGVIVQSGNHSQLMSDGGLYERLYTMQFREEV